MNRWIIICLLLTSVSRAETEITLGVLPGLRYDIQSFVVRPGEPVSIHFKNNDGMQHNLVIAQPGSREKLLQAAIALGAEGPTRHFVPDSPLVLHATPVIAMNEDAWLKFNAPKVPGDYPFVCTFPGHGFLMYGNMKVDAKLPKTVEKNVIELATKDQAVIERPIVVRTFLPHSSPAAIAVALPGGQHYIWDAGQVHLRMVWSEGGWLDYGTQRRHAESNGKGVVKFTQTPHYEAGAAFPFSVKGPDQLVKPQFKGYRLLDGYPEFLFHFDGVKARELIRLADTGKGVVRSFTMSCANGHVLFKRPAGSGDRISSSKGKWEGDTLILTPEEAQRFTLTILEPAS